MSLEMRLSSEIQPFIDRCVQLEKSVNILFSIEKNEKVQKQVLLSLMLKVISQHDNPHKECLQLVKTMLTILDMRVDKESIKFFTNNLKPKEYKKP